ncbi:MAG: tetratricopeptide repeat protein, partial [Rubricoccaceae bacterium]|nr:tetratricopeptide repeat protein [Rubricoccaceae bacterium]
IATGHTADRHGILNFIQPTEDGTGVRPVLGTSRKVKAFWNILNQEGLRSNVVGWWPSHPAEPIDGVMVTNFFHKASGPVFEPWPVADGAVHPPELAELMGALRVHPHELTGSHLLPFVPDAEQVDTTKDRRLESVAKILAEASTIHSVATWALEHTEWDLTAVYYDAIDHFGHGFMKYHPPRRPGIPEATYERYKDVVVAGYRFHDMMLERLLALAGDDTTVILLSDHGFHSDHLRPQGLPDEPAAPAHEHRTFGVFVMAGPGIKRDERVYGVSLLDVAPTVLSLFGLPIGRDMAGKPVLEAFEAPPEPAFIPSWEDVDGDDGRHPDDLRSDPWAEQEAMRQLVELGYVDPGEGQGPERVARVQRESQFYLARVHLSQGRPAAALPLLEAAFADDPEAERYGLRLVEALRLLGRTDDAHATLDRVLEGRTRLLERKIARIDEGLAQLDERAEAVADDETEERRQARAARVEALQTRRATLQRRLDTVPPGLHYHRGLILLSEGEAQEALGAFQAAESAAEQFPHLYVRLGEAFLLLKRWADAEGAFRKALAVDPDVAAVHRGLALACLRQDRLEEAAMAALQAVGLRHFFPAAHFHLGEALMRLGEHPRAAEAFEVALRQQPGLRMAHVYLSELYRNYLDEPQKAAEHLRLAAEDPPAEQTAKP